MKKFLFLSMIALAALASCSKDDDTTKQPYTITASAADIDMNSITGVVDLKALMWNEEDNAIAEASFSSGDFNITLPDVVDESMLISVYKFWGVEGMSEEIMCGRMFINGYDEAGDWKCFFMNQDDTYYVEHYYSTGAFTYSGSGFGGIDVLNIDIVAGWNRIYSYQVEGVNHYVTTPPAGMPSIIGWTAYIGF